MSEGERENCGQSVDLRYCRLGWRMEDGGQVVTDLSVRQPLYVLYTALVISEDFSDLRPAPVLDLLVEGEVQHQPLQAGGGRLRPRQQEVEQIHGEVVSVETLVILHGYQVNVNEVPRIFWVKSYGLQCGGFPSAFPLLVDLSSARGRAETSAEAERGGREEVVFS